ncbi:hypothetical protein EB796_017835 [Bugula neritina]|uniref:Helicase C-terminal domain-containing protein n=1 Tax=Bugula neritina TaxID=10212 RepID=A0A7J7JCN9_BUGNE|nr:hypothetical protein EB796_017835 [Bugula neritina]
MEAWKDLFVPLPVLKSLHELNFLTPTLIQGLTLPSAIRDRLDILGAAETVVSIFGGLSSQKQVRLLKSRPEIVVATPGRLWDIMNGEEEIEEFLSTIVECPLLVIDEADKMVEKDELIETVGILKRPKVIDVTVKSQTASSLVESCIFCTQSEKDLYLYYFLKNHEGRTLIFTNSIDCIRRLLSVFSLLKKTLLPLHASMHQKQRLKNLERFTQSETGILLATDVAARGLDIPNVQHVIHYQVPRTAESYVHRSGRTARALKDGLSVVFVDEKDIQGYKKILKSLHKDDALSPFPVVQEDLKQLKPIVSLAQRIDTTTHRTEKARRHDDWFVKMAKDADLDISDGESPHADLENDDVLHTYNVTVRSGEPALKSIVSLDTFQPKVVTQYSDERAIEAIVTGESVDVAIHQAFTQTNGTILGFTLIVCEINPFVENSHYDTKFPPTPDSYDQVSC